MHLNGNCQADPSLRNKVYYYLNIYVLQVIAHGEGDDNFSADATVHLNVTNVNDNSPNFTKSEFSRTVDEDLDVGRPVVTVTVRCVCLFSLFFTESCTKNMTT